jgi:hypothetical protein
MKSRIEGDDLVEIQKSHESVMAFSGSVMGNSEEFAP